VSHPGATGVIYCSDRAMANGFSYGNEEWVRLFATRYLAFIIRSDRFSSSSCCASVLRSHTEFPAA
jgi:hypothetical protein